MTNKCYICGDEISDHSQACGSCMRWSMFRDPHEFIVGRTFGDLVLAELSANYKKEKDDKKSSSKPEDIITDSNMGGDFVDNKGACEEQDK